MKIILGCGLIVFCLALALGMNALLAYGAQFVLAAFGLHVSFWVCFVAILVIGTLFNSASRSSPKS
jgi:hypothetical protein